jgi:hypothetical protein
MNEKFLLLSKNIRRDVQTIAEIYHQRERHPTVIDNDTPLDTLILIAYHIHNLYNAFENIFQNIATTFENSLGDKSQWHAKILERMALDVMPLRPAVIDDQMHDELDELRRFRHMFRHSYRVRLDAARLQLVLSKALTLKQHYDVRIELFLAFLQTIEQNSLHCEPGNAGVSPAGMQAVCSSQERRL